MATVSMLKHTLKVLAFFLCAVTCSADRFLATSDTIIDTADNDLLGTQCASGKYKTSSGNCANCEQGKYEIGGKCKACPNGKTSAAGSAAASDCKKTLASLQGSGTNSSDFSSGSGSSQDSPHVAAVLNVVLAVLLVSVLIACCVLRLTCWDKSGSKTCPQPTINTDTPKIQFSVKNSQSDCDDIEMGQMDGSRVTLPDCQSPETPTKTREEASHPPKKAPCRPTMSHPPKKAPQRKSQWHPLPESRIERPVVNHNYRDFQGYSCAADNASVNLAYALS